MRENLGLWLAAAAALAITAAADGAQAQAKPGAAGARKPKVIQLEEITIEGRVQKPNAFYILNRSSLNFRASVSWQSVTLPKTQTPAS